MATPPVPRALRLVNVLALLLFVAGAALHIWSWFGMRSLESYVAAPGAPHFAGMERFNHYWLLSRTGTWLVGSALGVAVLAALAALVVRRRQQTEGEEPSSRE